QDASAFAKTSLGHEPPRALTPPPESPLVANVVAFVKKQPRWVVLAGSAALPLLFVVFVVVVVLVFRAPAATGPSGLTGGAESGEPVSPKVKRAPPERLKAAAAQGPDAVEALAKDFPDDPAVRRQLVLTYHLQGRSADAMIAVRALLASDEKASDDDEVVQ